MTASPQDFLKELPATVELETSGGKVILPHPTKIPFGIIRKANQLPEAEQFIFMFEQVADEATLAILDTLPMAEILILQTQWQQGAALGEFSGSEN